MVCNCRGGHILDSSLICLTLESPPACNSSRDISKIQSRVSTCFDTLVRVVILDGIILDLLGGLLSAMLWALGVTTHPGTDSVI